MMFVAFISHSCAFGSLVHQEAITYTSSIIKNLADKYSGTFDCWFYNILTKSPQEPIVDVLIAEPQLSLVPKLMMTISKPTQITRHPELVVIYCDDYRASSSHMWNILIGHAFHAPTKFIAIYQEEHGYEVNIMHQMFSTAKLHNVIYIRTPKLAVSYELMHTKKVFNRTGAVSFDQLFVDQTRDLAGYTVHVSVINILPSTDLSTRRKGIRAEWIRNTAAAINASCEFFKIDCDRMDAACEQRAFVLNQTKLYDMNLDASIFSELVPHFMYSMIPNCLLIVVPRGDKLPILQLFIIPFSYEVWIMLVVVLTICVILMIFLPDWFKNDLILLPICGFERRTLHDSSTVEKILVMSLTVFAFLLSCAYEAKIMALLSESPYEPDPKTFEDLVRKNITVYLHTNDSYIFQDNPKLQQVFKFKPEILKYVGECGPGFGYAVTANYWRHAMMDPKNYDPRTGRSRFAVLERYTMGGAVMFHFVGIRNPLREKFQETENTFLEAGLFTYWAEDYAREVLGTSYPSKFGSLDTSANECFELKDFILAWRILLLGCAAGFLMFVLEWCSTSCAAYSRRISGHI